MPSEALIRRKHNSRLASDSDLDYRCGLLCVCSDWFNKITYEYMLEVMD